MIDLTEENPPDVENHPQTPAVYGLGIRPRAGCQQDLWGEVGGGATERLQHRLTVNELGQAKVSHLMDITWLRVTEHEPRFSVHANNLRCNLKQICLEFLTKNSYNLDNKDFFCANILENQAQWRDKSKGLSTRI